MKKYGAYPQQSQKYWIKFQRVLSKIIKETIYTSERVTISCSRKHALLRIQIVMPETIRKYILNVSTEPDTYIYTKPKEIKCMIYIGISISA